MAEWSLREQEKRRQKTKGSSAVALTPASDRDHYDAGKVVDEPSALAKLELKVEELREQNAKHERALAAKGAVIRSKDNEIAGLRKRLPRGSEDESGIEWKE